MTKNKRTIMTWTWCCNRAKYMRQHSKADFNDLCSRGTDRFIPGHWVSLDGNNFRVHRSATNGSRRSVDVGGRISADGRLWTVIKTYLTPTTYKKSFWDKYMPVTFPTGLPKRGQSAGCLFHSVDGKTQPGYVEFTNHRGETARLSIRAAPGWLAIEDATGKLVHIDKSSLAAVKGRPTQSTDVVEYIEFSQQDESTYFTFPATRPVSFQEFSGQHEYACETRTQWLKSIAEACNAGLMDLHKVLPLAARMWNAAYQFCRDNSAKRAYFLAYPLAPKKQGVDGRGSQGEYPWAVLRWNGGQWLDLNGKKELAPLNLDYVEQYYLPHIVIKFESGERPNTVYRHLINVPCSLRDPSHITMTLPPHGNPLLHAQDHYGALDGRVYPAMSRMRGERDWSNQDVNTNSVTHNPESIVRHLERAYHALPIVKPSDDADWRYMHNCGLHGRWGNANKTWAASQADGGRAERWQDHEDCVHVRTDFDDKEGNGIYNPRGVMAAMDLQGVGFAATPESAVGMVEESVLIDSLPLS